MTLDVNRHRPVLRSGRQLHRRRGRGRTETTHTARLCGTHRVVKGQYGMPY